MVKAREEILRVHGAGVKIDPAIDFAIIARGAVGFSGADLAHLINEAALIATKKGQDMVTIIDLEEARDRIILGKERRSYVMTPQEIKETAYHEAGHSLVRMLIPYADPLHKVTILPRGKALGVSFSLPDRDRVARSKQEYIADIMIAMGGRAAEDLVFNSISSGAANDFSKATESARTMVCVLGMTDELGPVSYDQSSFKYSQKTAEKIDDTVRSILVEAYAKAKQMLQENRDKLEKLALALLERETMYADEIYVLLGMEPRESFRWTKNTDTK
jgi:cell division protease FtsH